MAPPAPAARLEAAAAAPDLTKHGCIEQAMTELAACGVPGADGFGTALQSITIDSNATYTIVGVESNRCVQIEGASTANLARAEIGACNGSTAQRFRITPVSGAAGFFQREPAAVFNRSHGGQVHMIWWYQHHGRIAYDGANYASYFSEALSVSENSCINIHEGDRMKVVGPTGSLLSGHDSFDWGCSHSWNTRIVWDPAINRFITVCATDNNNRIARSPGMQTIYSSLDLPSLSLGNIVLANGGGYWISASDQGSIRLPHFTSTNATPDRTVIATSSPFSHLASYGANNMLLAWESGTSMAAQVRSASDGSAIGPQLTVGVADHRYQDFKSFPDGSVAYPARGSTAQSVRIARVLPCSN